MVMVVMGVGKALGSLENSLVLGMNTLEVKVHRGCLKYLNAMELGNESKT
jgi:hypothetical protein